MDSHDIRTLRLLEEIQNGQMPSQRDLARSLDISLGLVNSFVKRLASKGYFKITNIPKNRVKYILTPKGAAEKTRLTYQYIQYSFVFYKNARQRLRTLFREMEEEGVTVVAFCGASDLAEIAHLSMQETGISLTGIIDDERANKSFFGHQIRKLDDIGQLRYDRVLITAATGQNQLVTQLTEKNSVPRRSIVLLE